MSKTKNFIPFILNPKSGDLEFLGVFTCLGNAFEKIKDDYILLKDIEEGLTDVVIYSQLPNEYFDSSISELEWSTKNIEDKQKLFA